MHSFWEISFALDWMEWQKPGLKIYPLRPVGTEPILSVNFQWYALPFIFHRNNRCKSRRFFLMFTIFKCTEFNGVHVICVRTLAQLNSCTRLYTSFKLDALLICLSNNPVKAKWMDLVLRSAFSGFLFGEQLWFTRWGESDKRINSAECFGMLRHIRYRLRLFDLLFPRFKFQFITSWNSLIIPK